MRGSKGEMETDRGKITLIRWELVMTSQREMETERGKITLIRCDLVMTSQKERWRQRESKLPL